MDWFWYLLDGNGHWMTRWHCTNHDPWLAGAMVVACVWMVAEYIVYALQSHSAMKNFSGQLDEAIAIRHLRDLRNVFLQCGSIHFLNMVVAWVWTPYLAIAVFTAVNAYSARRLNQDKSALAAIQQQQLMSQELNNTKNANVVLIKRVAALVNKIDDLKERLGESR